MFILIIILAVGFAIINGFNDAANAIATVIGTRVLSPIKAVAMAAVFNFVGAATGLAVAITIGKGIVAPDYLDYGVIIAALAAVIIWGAAATYLGLPVSISHSFVAGLVGAGIAAAGSISIVWGTFGKVVASVAIAPALGFAGGLLLMVALLWILRRRAPLKVEGLFSRLQILSAAFMSYAHGKNDGQMPIGIMAMALMIHTGGTEFHVPFWIIGLSAGAISLGTAFGGRRVIRTVGMRITALRPVQGFAAITAAAAVVETASVLGIPVSTTHCVSSSVMGVGSTKRFSAVRWGVARSIVLAWVLTFPICGGIGWALGLVLT
ncbi:MAG: inorganic phosphate transporter [Chloroflexota bacterium]|nr:inorganic phosphate transporter [Chloroflexota bacterium]